ncbi:putative reverse transcriptase domain-containing protein [Tanacetum coccineum]
MLNEISISEKTISGIIVEDVPFQKFIGKVTTLDLSHTHLNGSIPDSIGRLATLTVLDLSINQLTLHIPTSLGSLVSLQLFSVSSNSLKGTVPASIRALIARGMADALAKQEIQRNTNLNGDGSQGSGNGITRPVRPTRECTYNDFHKCQLLNFKDTEGVVGLTYWFERMETVFHIIGHDALMQCPWKTLIKMMTVKYCPRSEIKKLEIEILEPEGQGNKDNAEWAIRASNGLMDQKAQDYTARTGKRKEYAGTLPLCNKCKFHHNGSCTAKTTTCYECGNQGHYKSDCPELKNQNHGNQAEGTEARGMVYNIRGENRSNLDDME